MISRTRLALLAVVLLQAGLVQACGSDSVVDPAPAPAPTTAAPAPSSSTSEPAAPEPTSATPGPEFDPPIPAGTPVAKGPQVRLLGLTATLPTGYRVLPSDVFTKSLVSAHVPGKLRYLTLQSVTSGSYQQSTTATAKEVAKASGYLRQPRRMPDVVVDGVRMFHLEGAISAAEDVETYGSETTGYQLLIELKWERGVPLAERRATTQSLLATVRVREG